MREAIESLKNVQYFLRYHSHTYNLNSSTEPHAKTFTQSITELHASKIQKLAVRCFLLTSAKAKKFQDGDRLIRLYTTISLPATFFFFFQKSTQFFFKRTHVLSSMGSKRSKTKHYRRLQKPFLFPETV